MDRGARRAERVVRQLGRRTEREALERRRGRPARPRAARPALRAVAHVEQQRPELDRGDAVDHRVVDLAGEHGLARPRTRHDEQLPQRPVAVEPAAEELVAAPSRVGTRGRPPPPHRLHVGARVERRVLDPPGVEHGRRPHEPLAEARDVVEPGLDLGHQAADVERPRRAGLEDRQPADVHVRGVRLELQEGRVEGVESFHPSHRPAGTTCGGRCSPAGRVTSCTNSAPSD